MVWAATRPAGLSGSGSRITTSKPSSAAARLSMRPSWPPPMMPMAAPGASGKEAMSPALSVFHRLGNGLRLPGGEGGDPVGYGGIGERQDLGREDTGVLGARLADSQG